MRGRATPEDGERILVIKLGALGDVVQALGPFRAIREHHPRARVTLLTTAPYAEFLADSGLFDEIQIDDRPRGLRLGAWLALRRRLRAGRYDRVYDLQTSDRSSWYFHLMGPGPRPEWSGIARGCSHPHANPARDDMHTLERQAEQLRDAGIPSVPPPSLDWCRADVERFGLDGPTVLLVPGGARHRPEKRWPADRYAALARHLLGLGYRPVILGGRAERALARDIVATAPGAADLTGETDFQDIAVLARRAAAAVGNDTGPMHIVAVAGCGSVVLFSAASDPALCAPRGRAVRILRRDRLDRLGLAEVLAALEPLLASPAAGGPPAPPDALP